MANKYYVKHKEKLRKEAHGRYQNLSRDKKGKRSKMPETDIQIFLKDKKIKSVIIIVIKIRIFLRKKNKINLNIWEIII